MRQSIQAISQAVQEKKKDIPDLDLAQSIIAVDDDIFEDLERIALEDLSPDGEALEGVNGPNIVRDGSVEGAELRLRQV